jgi:hypothetical protein
MAITLPLLVGRELGAERPMQATGVVGGKPQRGPYDPARQATDASWSTANT